MVRSLSSITSSYCIYDCWFCFREKSILSGIYLDTYNILQMLFNIYQFATCVFVTVFVLHHVIRLSSTLRRLNWGLRTRRLEIAGGQSWVDSMLLNFYGRRWLYFWAWYPFPPCWYVLSNCKTPRRHERILRLPLDLLAILRFPLDETTLLGSIFIFMGSLLQISVLTFLRILYAAFIYFVKSLPNGLRGREIFQMVF
jgi:hypothetical protein